jgi:outer membrane protein insertion porin family
VQLGYGYENTLVRLQQNVSTQVLNFTNEHGSHFGQVDLIAGASRDSRDKAIFPTSGTLNTIGANLYMPAGAGSLKYYTLGYSGKWYYPLTESFIAVAKGQLGYGTGFGGAKDFPYFKNYFAGGIDSVRGYLANTLGPRDSNQKPTGGNELVTATAGLVFPNYISENFRTTVFVDAGNVYNSYNNRSEGGTASGPLRYSAGIEGDWLTMFGLIDVSLAKPLNRQTRHGINDDQEIPQFSLGANFG